MSIDLPQHKKKSSKVTVVPPDAVKRKPDDEETEVWSLKQATRPVQYIPVSRNSQLLLMKKLTTRHLWSDAVKVMKMLLTDARHPPLVVFRYGMLVLQHYAPTDDSSFRQYYRDNMLPFVTRFVTRASRDRDKIVRAYLRNVNRKEMILDVSAILFQHHCDEEIDELFELLRNQSGGDRHLRRTEKQEKNPVIENIYNGYETYMRFLRWRKQRKGSSRLRDREDDDDGGVNDQEKVIVQHLESTVTSSGDMSVDLFLESLLQMLESKGKYEDAVRVTDLHSIKHVNDLHAHLRHYDMIDKRIDQIRDSGDDDEDDDVRHEQELVHKKILCFRQIVRLAPCHPLVRDVSNSDQFITFGSNDKSRECGVVPLKVPTNCNPEWLPFQELKPEEDLTARIRLLMNFVDYRTNMQDVTAWQAMHKLMLQLSQTDGRSFRSFRRFFSARLADYWESVHFNPQNVAQETKSVIESKVQIAQLLDVCFKYKKASKRRL